MRSLHSETHLVSRIGWLRRSEDMLRCGANTGNRIGTRRSLGSEIMTYTLDKTIKGLPFDDMVAAAKVALATKGFGVLTEIDVRATMKKKLDVDMADYLILGACNPNMALEAMKIEPRVGAMLPCNVIVRSLENGTIMVSAIDPVASMQAIDNPHLKTVAGQVRSLLQDAVAAI